MRINIAREKLYKVKLILIVAIVGVLLFFLGNNAFGAYVPTPHGNYNTGETEKCANCHISHQGSDGYMSTKTSEYNLCMACHDGVSGPLAIKFPSTYQHTWPGKSSCGGCHDQHKSTTTVPKLLRDTYNSSAQNVDPTQYQLCFDCHQTTAKTGPGFVQSTYNIYQFYINPTTGKEGVDKGHYIKNYNGNVYKFSDGVTTIPTNYQLRCTDCHNRHGSGNKKLLRTTLGTNTTTTITLTDTTTTGLTTAEERSFCKGCHNGTNHLYYSGAGDSPIPWDVTLSDGHLDTSTQKCSECHGGATTNQTMRGAHAPARAESVGGVNCNGCHKSIYNASGTTTTNAHHVSANTITFDGTQYNKTQNCLQCHLDHDLFRPDLDPVNNKRGSNLRELFDSTTGAHNRANTDFIGKATDAAYTKKGGICLSCHFTQQAKAYAAGQNTHVVAQPAAYDASAHNYTVNTKFVDDNTDHNANCAKCHNDDITKTGAQSPNKFGTHSSNYTSILSPFGDITLTNPMNEKFCYKCHNGNTAVTTDVYGTPNMMSVAAKDVYNKFNTTGWSKHITGRTGSQVNCVSCHGSHTVTKNKFSAGLADSDISDPSNTLNPWITTSGDISSFCIKCHSGNLIKASNTTTAFVPMDILFSNTNFTTNNSGWNKSAFTSSRHYTNTTYKVQCIDCHDKHGSQYRLLLNAPDDTATVDGSCFKCHNGTKTATPNIKNEFLKTYRHPSLDTTAGPHSNTENYNNLGATNRHAECEDCHDPHEATNTTATAPAAPGMVQGVSGVGVGVRTAWTSLPYNSLTYTFKKKIDYEYELCYKCHSTYNWGSTPPTAPSGGLETDIAQQFNSANASFHPVEAAGKNPMTGLAENFNLASPFRVASAGTAKMYCFDCHGDDQLKADGYTVQVKGPHGSANKYMLKKPYDKGTANAVKNDLCIMCHAAAVYDSSTTANGNATGFRDSGGSNLHLQHRNSYYPSYAGGSGTWFCGDCHGLYVHGQNRAHLIVYQSDPAPYNAWTAITNYNHPNPGSYAENSCQVGINPRTGYKCYSGH